VAGKAEDPAEQRVVGVDQPLAIGRSDEGNAAQAGKLQHGTDCLAARSADQQTDIGRLLEQFDQFVGGVGVEQRGRANFVGDVIGWRGDRAGAFHDVQRNGQVYRPARRARGPLQGGDQLRLDLFWMRDQRVVAGAVAEHAERVDPGARRFLQGALAEGGQRRLAGNDQ